MNERKSVDNSDDFKDKNLSRSIEGWKTQYNLSKERYKEQPFLLPLDIYIDANQAFPLQPYIILFETFFRAVAIGLPLRDVLASGMSLKPYDLIDNLTTEILPELLKKVNTVYKGNIDVIRQQAVKRYGSDAEVIVQAEKGRPLDQVFSAADAVTRLRTLAGTFLVATVYMIDPLQLDKIVAQFEKKEHADETEHIPIPSEMATYIDAKLANQEFRKYLLNILAQRRKEFWKLQSHVLANARVGLLDPTRPGAAEFNLKVIVNGEDQTRELLRINTQQGMYPDKIRERMVQIDPDNEVKIKTMR